MARHVFPGQTVHVHQGHDGFRNRVVHPQVRHRVHEPLVQRAGPHQPRALRGAVLVIRHGLVCCGVAVGLAAVRVLLAPASAARCARHPGRPAARVAFPRALESLERPALLHAVMVRHHLLVRNRGGGVVYAAPGVRGVPVVGMGIHAARRWVPGVTSTHRRRVRRLLLREVVRHRVLVHLHLRMRMRGGSGGGGVPGVLRRRLLRHRRHRGGGGVCGGDFRRPRLDHRASFRLRSSRGPGPCGVRPIRRGVRDSGVVVGGGHGEVIFVHRVLRRFGRVTRGGGERRRGRGERAAHRIRGGVHRGPRGPAPFQGFPGSGGEQRRARHEVHADPRVSLGKPRRHGDARRGVGGGLRASHHHSRVRERGLDVRPEPGKRGGELLVQEAAYRGPNRRAVQARRAPAPAAPFPLRVFFLLKDEIPIFFRRALLEQAPENPPGCASSRAVAGHLPPGAFDVANGDRQVVGIDHADDVDRAPHQRLLGLTKVTTQITSRALHVHPAVRATGALAPVHLHGGGDDVLALLRASRGGAWPAGRGRVHVHGVQNVQIAACTRFALHGRHRSLRGSLGSHAALAVRGARGEPSARGGAGTVFVIIVDHLRRRGQVRIQFLHVDVGEVLR
mmetsp:Transcript_580/g.1942  ORF Transcript_580/g.1942 Transcript_580/m.1942 type:complete len:619 (+) Transcript_580:840-2696(+)